MNNLYEMFYNSYLERADSNYIYDKKYWTYKDVNEYIDYVAQMLLEEEIQVDDKVLLYIDNSIEYVMAYFAVLRLGATVVPIISTTSVENIENIINDCCPKLMLSSPIMYHKIKNCEFTANLKSILLDVRKMDVKESMELPPVRTGRLAMIIYTSGTMSKSKGVMLSHKNLLTNTDSILDYLKLTNEDSVLATLSFAYSYGNSILLTHTKVGGMLYLYKAIYPQSILTMLDSGQFTGFSTVGSFLNILLKQDNLEIDSFSKLRYITLAGEQTAKSNLLKVQSMNEKLKIYVMYGQTEASARLTYLEPDMLNEKLGSVGKPIKSVEIKVVDDSGNEVENNTNGEIIVRGDNVMEGYLNQPEETEKVLRNGWLWTGDIGYQDEEGYIYITGRKRDVIKYKGFRISPVEIENYINLDKGILESGVFEKSEDDYVEIAAAIVLSGLDFDKDSFLQELKRKLPLYKIPKYFYVLKELPKTSNGKIKRQALKEEILKCKEDEIYEYSV